LNDNRHGTGTYTWADGDRFEGIWENGSRYGRGMFYHKDGHITCQEWDEISEPPNANYALSPPAKFPSSSSSST